MRPVLHGGRRAGLLALAFALAMPTGIRAADDDLERCVAALDDAEIASLTARVEPVLRERQRGARWWLWGWLAVNAGFVVGASVLTLVAEEPVWRDANIWSAVGSGATLLLLFAPPPPSAFASRRLGPEGTPSRARLARALRLVEEGAAVERGIKGWPTHVATGAYALAEGLYLGLRYDAPGAALANVVTSIVISEAQAWTSPRAMTRLEATLIEESAPCVGSVRRASPTAQLVPTFGGLFARVTF